MATYSHSRLSTYQQCPLKFKFLYIDELETEIGESVEMFLGSRVHEALEKLYADLRYQKLLSLHELLNDYNNSWQKNWNDKILIVKTDYDSENYRKMGEKYLTDYYNRLAPFDQARTIDLETQATVPLDSAGTYHIHVRIDRLALDHDIYEIHDYKTSSWLPPQDKLDSDRQLALYAYGVKKLYPDAVRIRLIWHFLAFDKDLVSERSDDQLEKLRQDVLSLIHEIEIATEFPAKESALCQWCEFQPLCPRFKHLFKTDALEPNEYLKEEGVVLVNKYAEFHEMQEHAAAELEKIREALLSYCEREGVETLAGSNVIASIRSYPKNSFPKKGEPAQREFFETLKKVGLWERLSVPDVYELSKLINSRQLRPEELGLDRFITKGKTTCVYLRRRTAPVKKS
jgi:putative RecB family exonuclease